MKNRSVNSRMNQSNEQSLGEYSTSFGFSFLLFFKDNLYTMTQNLLHMVKFVHEILFACFIMFYSDWMCSKP